MAGALYGHIEPHSAHLASELMKKTWVLLPVEDQLSNDFNASINGNTAN